MGECNLAEVIKPANQGRDKHRDYTAQSTYSNTDYFYNVSQKIKY